VVTGFGRPPGIAEQTKVILLFRLGLAHALKGAKRTVLIQDNGRWFGGVSRHPFMEGLKKWSEGFGTMLQFDGMRCSVHSNNSSRTRGHMLETFQNIPNKGQCQFLLLADAVRPYKN